MACTLRRVRGMDDTRHYGRCIGISITIGKDCGASKQAIREVYLASKMEARKPKIKVGAKEIVHVK
jgi:hypothetical protein